MLLKSRMFFIALLMVAFSVNQKAEAGPSKSFIDSVSTECRLKYSDQRNEVNGLYRVQRDGDSLYARYRHNEGRDLVRTDDVTFRHIEGEEALDLYNQNGLLDLILNIAGVGRSALVALNYYGIDQRDDGTFEMELWKLMGAEGVRLEVVASGGEWHAVCEKSRK